MIKGRRCLSICLRSSSYSGVASSRSQYFWLQSVCLLNCCIYCRPALPSFIKSLYKYTLEEVRVFITVLKVLVLCMYLPYYLWLLWGHVRFTFATWSFAYVFPWLNGESTIFSPVICKTWEIILKMLMLVHHSFWMLLGFEFHLNHVVLLLLPRPVLKRDSCWSKPVPSKGGKSDTSNFEVVHFIMQRTQR